MIRAQPSRSIVQAAVLAAALAAAPGAGAQTPSPPQFINGSTCSFDTSQGGLYVFGPYLGGSRGIAYCSFAPPIHNFGQPLPTLSSVNVSGYTREGGQIRSQACATVSFAGPARIYCGPERISVGDFNDALELPRPIEAPTAYFVIVSITSTVGPPAPALSGLSVVWLR